MCQSLLAFDIQIDRRGENLMKKLISIGEALIDFIPTESGKKIKQVDGFKPAVGGAPANVCAAFTKLGTTTVSRWFVMARE